MNRFRKTINILRNCSSRFIGRQRLYAVEVKVHKVTAEKYKKNAHHLNNRYTQMEADKQSPSTASCIRKSSDINKTEKRSQSFPQEKKMHIPVHLKY